MTIDLEPLSGSGRNTTIPALINTGLERTIVTPEAVKAAELAKVNEIPISRLGGTTDERAEVFIASLEFPRIELKTINMIEVVCCELPTEPPIRADQGRAALIQCLLGRDVIARWVFTYNGPLFEWKIEE